MVSQNYIYLQSVKICPCTSAETAFAVWKYNSCYSSILLHFHVSFSSFNFPLNSEFTVLVTLTVSIQNHCNAFLGKPKNQLFHSIFLAGKTSAFTISSVLSWENKILIKLLNTMNISISCSLVYNTSFWEALILVWYTDTLPQSQSLPSTGNALEENFTFSI